MVTLAPKLDPIEIAGFSDENARKPAKLLGKVKSLVNIATSKRYVEEGAPSSIGGEQPAACNNTSAPLEEPARWAGSTCARFIFAGAHIVNKVFKNLESWLFTTSN